MTFVAHSPPILFSMVILSVIVASVTTIMCMLFTICTPINMDYHLGLHVAKNMIMKV